MRNARQRRRVHAALYCNHCWQPRGYVFFKHPGCQYASSFLNRHELCKTQEGEQQSRFTASGQLTLSSMPNAHHAQHSSRSSGSHRDVTDPYIGHHQTEHPSPAACAGAHREVRERRALFGAHMAGLARARSRQGQVEDARTVRRAEAVAICSLFVVLLWGACLIPLPAGGGRLPCASRPASPAMPLREVHALTLIKWLGPLKSYGLFWS